MSAENTPTTPQTPAAAPAAAPAAPEKPKSLDEAYAQVTKPAAPQAPTTQETPAAAAQKRLLKAKLDKEEKEYDWDEWTKEQWEKGRAKDVIERDYALDHVRERTQREASEATRKAWNEFIEDQKFDLVAAPGTRFGWRLVPRQAATPAQDPPDPLAKEEQDLLPKAREGDPEAVLRISEIRAERAKQAAVKEWETKQAQERQNQTRREAYEKAKGWLYGEIDKLFTARAKSFEGLAKVSARLRNQAFAAGEAAAREGGDALAAARAVIYEEADDLDARAETWRKSLPTTPAKPEAPNVLGTAPAGGGGKPKFKDIDEAYAAVERQLNGRR